MTAAGGKASAHVQRLLGPAVLLLAAAGCTAATVRRTEVPHHEHPAGVSTIRWHTTLHDRGIAPGRPEECASGALVGDRLVIGSRAGNVVAVRTSDGSVLWTTPVSGGVDSQARYDETQGQVYAGTDDGYLYALDPANGKVRWFYKGRGAFERRPEIGGDAIYATSSADRVVALESRTGRVVWQYERDAPEGFTIHGYAGPRLHYGFVYAGFSDGFLTAINAGTGDVVWARSLASASEQYVDVDATPAVVGNDTLIASSYSGGLYALNTSNGDVKWRLSIEGAGPAQVVGDRVYFASAREGLTALSARGDVLWRQGLADAGDLTVPQVVGPLLIFSGSRAGLFIVNRADGRLLEVFNPGRGVCASATVGPDGHTLYVLANSGTLYALQLAY